MKAASTKFVRTVRYDGGMNEITLTCPVTGCHLKGPHYHSADDGSDYMQYTPEVKIKLDPTIPEGHFRMGEETKEPGPDPIDKLVELLIPDGQFLLITPDELKAKVDSLFADYRRITEIDAEAKAIHDRVCGDGMHVHQNGHPLSDVYYGVRDDIALQLGHLILDPEHDG